MKIHQAVFNALNPTSTIAAGIQSRLILSPAATKNVGDPLDQVTYEPEFKQATYKYLAEISQDWLLPGLDEVPDNTVTLVEANQRFVESFLLGANVEMARELLWHEYPVPDQKGTYFRQFWDPILDKQLDEEAGKDIQRINTWGNSSLGDNSSRHLAGRREHLVLLMRASLLRLYPDAIIYAVKAKWDGNFRKLDTIEKFPLFTGTLKPDVSFFGFDITPEEAMGSDGPPGDAGWYIVIQEHISQPRFGLDIERDGSLDTWGDLAWTDLVPSGTDPARFGYIDLNAPPPSPSQPGAVMWGKNATHMAIATLQQPVRIAIHASDMLPSNQNSQQNPTGTPPAESPSGGVQS